MQKNPDDPTGESNQGFGVISKHSTVAIKAGSASVYISIPCDDNNDNNHSPYFDSADSEFL